MKIISQILVAVYCLPLHRLALIMVVACGIFLKMREKFGKRLWWKLLVLAGLGAGVCLIILQTFWNREPSNVQLAPILTPFHTYRTYLEEPFEEILRMNFMNTVLFLPAGLFLCELMPLKWSGWIKVLTATLLLGMMSGQIEYIQFVRALGQAEIDDVIHNILGAFIGSILAALPRPTSVNRTSG